MKPCVECVFPLWCTSVFIDGPLAFKLVESFGVLARLSRRLSRRVERAQQRYPIAGLVRQFGVSVS